MVDPSPVPPAPHDGSPSRTTASRRRPIWYLPYRWMYRGGRPHRLAKVMNALSAWQYGRGWLTLGLAATLEVRGRSSGKPVRLPIVVANHEGIRYLVSMLGDQANWVQNVRAADGAAVLIHKSRQPVRLVEIPVQDRAPLLRRYLAMAPGARPHIPVSRTAPLAEFERIAADYPVFRIDDID